MKTTLEQMCIWHLNRSQAWKSVIERGYPGDEIDRLIGNCMEEMPHTASDYPMNDDVSELTLLCYVLNKRLEKNPVPNMIQRVMDAHREFYDELSPRTIVEPKLEFENPVFAPKRTDEND